MSKEHTQLPWKAYRNYVTSDDGDTCIAAVDGETTDHATANRNLIVRAVNSHEAFVSFAKKYLATWPAAGPEDELATMARAALALAKEGV